MGSAFPFPVSKRRTSVSRVATARDGIGILGIRHQALEVSGERLPRERMARERRPPARRSVSKYLTEIPSKRFGLLGLLLDVPHVADRDAARLPSVEGRPKRVLTDHPDRGEERPQRALPVVGVREQQVLPHGVLVGHPHFPREPGQHPDPAVPGRARRPFRRPRDPRRPGGRRRRRPRAFWMGT